MVLSKKGKTVYPAMKSTNVAISDEASRDLLEILFEEFDERLYMILLTLTRDKVLEAWRGKVVRVADKVDNRRACNL
jgi:hypothetical protein